MLYFDHDASASTDPKIMQLRLECGGAAVDAYWYLVEQMHREEGAICVGDAGALRVHCHTLCAEKEDFKTWILAMISVGLMHSEDGAQTVFSTRAITNVNEYKAKREKASSAAKSRWSNADADKTHKRGKCDRNATAMPIKEKKRNSSNTIKSITTTNASGDAASDKPAPPSANPFCPMCDTPIWKNTQTGEYHCNNCHDTFDKGKVVWR